MDYVLLVMLIFFSACAIVEGFFSYSAMRRAYERSFRRQLIFIPVTENMTDIEAVMRETLRMVQSSWMDCRIIICDMGADEETMQICRRFSAENEIFEICSGEEAASVLRFL